LRPAAGCESTRLVGFGLGNESTVVGILGGRLRVHRQHTISAELQVRGVSRRVQVAAGRQQRDPPRFGLGQRRQDAVDTHRRARLLFGVLSR